MERRGPSSYLKGIECLYHGPEEKVVDVVHVHQDREAMLPGFISGVGSEGRREGGREGGREGDTEVINQYRANVLHNTNQITYLI